MGKLDTGNPMPGFGGDQKVSLLSFMKASNEAILNLLFEEMFVY